MKKIYKLLFIISVLGIFFISCNKEPNLPMPELKKGVVPKLTLGPNSSNKILTSNLNDFTGSIIVDVYYDDKPKSMDLYVSLNDTSGLLKSNITEFPTTVTFNLNDLVNALPNLESITEIVSGYKFDFFVVITLDDGTVINSNDTLYEAFSSSLFTQPGVSLDLAFEVVCSLNLADFVGQYDMFDGYPEDNCVVTVALDPDDPDGLIINDMYKGTGVDGIHPYHIKVNRDDYSISAKTQVVWDDLWGYGPGTLNPAKGELDACNTGISFIAEMTVSLGSFNKVTFILTKK